MQQTDEDVPAPRGVAVLGMSRSGTSAVTGLLSGAGFAMGGDEDDIMAADPHNPAGYFERYSIMRLNDELLAEAGGAWDDPPTEDGLARLGEGGRDRVHGAVQDLLAETAPAPLVVKDPRICSLLPLWADVLGPVLAPVLVVRHPLEIARSLAARENRSLPVGLALWELTWRAVFRHLHGRTVYVVHYSRLLEDPASGPDLLRWARSAVSPDVAKHLRDTTSIPARQDLRRQSADGAELTEIATVAQLRLWDAVSGLPTGPTVLSPADDLCTDPALLHAVAGADRAARDRADDLARALAAEVAHHKRAEQNADVAIAQAHELNVRLDQERQVVAGLQAKLDVEIERRRAIEAEVGARDRQVAVLQRERDALGAALVGSEQALARGGADARDRMDAEVSRARTEMVAALEELDRVRATFSWRATRALRAARERLG